VFVGDDRASRQRLAGITAWASMPAIMSFVGENGPCQPVRWAAPDLA